MASQPEEAKVRCVELELCVGVHRDTCTSGHRVGGDHSLVDAAGKPAFVYELAPGAEQLFPKAYGPVLQQLLEVLSERMSPDEVETLLGEVGRRIATRWNIAGGDLHMRLEMAVEILNELGGMAELEVCGDHYCIRGYSCPLAAVVPNHPEVCHLAETLLTELVGVTVEEQCDRNERLQCFFTVATSTSTMKESRPAQG